jgi:hypothetical protein
MQNVKNTFPKTNIVGCCDVKTILRFRRKAYMVKDVICVDIQKGEDA